jgi:DNA-binding MarR family transcriptional regulator
MSPSEPQWLDDDQQRAWRGLVLGMTLLMDRLDHDLQRMFGVSMAEYEILMAQLADAMAHSRSRVTHTVGRLEKSGLVRRNKSPEDGRGVVCHLTDEGFELLARMAPHHVNGVRDNLVDLVKPDDFEALGRVMNAVADHLVAGHPEMEIR